MRQLARHSPAKLPKVMIGVQISPAHPILRRHRPEYSDAPRRAKAGHRRNGRGWRATKQDPGGKSSGREPPLPCSTSGRVRKPLAHCRGTSSANRLSNVRCKKPVAGLAYFSPNANLVGVVQMAHHLVDGHSAPAGRIARRKLRHSTRIYSADRSGWPDSACSLGGIG